MADIVNICDRHMYQHNRKKYVKIEITKFENNGYFLITPRVCILLKVIQSKFYKLDHHYQEKKKKKLKNL